MMKSISGVSRKTRGFKCHVQKNTTLLLTARTVQAWGRDTKRCLPSVRGFFLSISQSIRRLKHMAAVRADTMHPRIHPKTRRGTFPPPATHMALRANGRANTVCENRTNLPRRIKKKGFETGGCISPTLRSGAVIRNPIRARQTPCSPARGLPPRLPARGITARLHRAKPRNQKATVRPAAAMG